MKYKVGQVVNIGYYGGFHNKTKIISKAVIKKIVGRFITVHVLLSNGGVRRMFGYESDLVKLENNYERWNKACLD